MISQLRYCHDLYNYQCRETRPVMVGKVQIGGGAPVVVQSMLTSDTRDADACVKEALGLAEAGCQIVRVTAQTRIIAENLQHIRDGLRNAGCDVPLVADIHFKPDAAMEAVKWVEKVRVNPGNYADKKKFAVKEYTDEEYAAEVAYMEEQFVPLVKECIRLNRAMRIGTNHGSLSDRIMNRWGDTPLGMVESALEFARIARAQGYHNFLFSMKASNPKVMIEAYRLLVAHLDACSKAELLAQWKREGNDEIRMTNDECDPRFGLPSSFVIRHSSLLWNYPIHLGVTEAGDGEDGRIKSAIGIGSLLADGIGDTVRVSLTEDAIFEIPVAQQLVKPYNEGVPAQFERIENAPPVSYDPFDFVRRESQVLAVNGVKVGGHETVPVFTSRKKWDAVAHKMDKLGDYKPEIVIEDSGVTEIDPRDGDAINSINAGTDAKLVTIKDGLKLPVIAAYRLLAAKLQPRHPILLKDTLQAAGSDDFTENLLVAATNIGSLLCDGIGDAVIVNGEEAPGQSLRISYNILQAAGVRIFKTDYVACPSCGRTLFNLQTTTQKIRAATGHLKGVRIAVMGCIVNGPGEMADADFGYVGGAPDKINLYVGKTAVKFNIPEEEAVERLIDLIKEHGRWFDAPVAA
ncbi:MAG: (E)-4-hydroxy-3-methylbut-2-enyl-diphosphate synthase [Prosthecobacter sp.]|jgi:(E)-4-hydroxy-3-methylbut-2-enyl-diphosphate synthase|uniref:(E)-4-hydroxy-3-methylbut-2-enyl-diphosphate synthase n=1 Tax=Prosthecobacter sp. TaxID=1965333 RepID=UPI0019DA22D2|nr:(E)-4-hydroxy-3-methylbut-2-enyl-diphosphate synthase [Prosthecobacter sp.]MBE2287826.1 (E)-4-hydroxy-3-methylbut-2-enyl-diphosphate synthase [Prosthecobacter sp.]